MGILCSCRDIRDTTINQFLDAAGQPVRVQDVLKSCANIENVSCCKQAPDCAGLVKIRVDAHNKKFTKDPQ